jgi:hypothetical protein
MRSRPLARESGDRRDRYEFLSEQAPAQKHWVNGISDLALKPARPG